MIFAVGFLMCLYDGCAFLGHLILHTEIEWWYVRRGEETICKSNKYEGLAWLIFSSIGVAIIVATLIASAVTDIPVTDKIVEETQLVVRSYEEESDGSLSVCYTENNRVAYVEVMPDSIRYDAKVSPYLERNKVLGYRKWWERDSLLLILPMEVEWTLHLPTT